MTAPQQGRFARVERDGPVTIVTIDRPEVMNALHVPAHIELAEIFDGFASDPDQWVAIVTGAGPRAFCAGNDLKSHSAGGTIPELPVSGFGGLTSRFDLAKPLIAAVNGLAMGGGFEIALACDIVIAADHAGFAFPEPRVGLAALAGGLHRLPRAIGLSRAMEIILTSRRVGAEEGARLGFVAQVVPADELLAAAIAVARQICEASPLAVRASKQAVLTGLRQDLPGAIADQWGYPDIARLLASQDAVEGPRAFAEKRPPRWQR